MASEKPSGETFRELEARALGDIARMLRIDGIKFLCEQIDALKTRVAEFEKGDAHLVAMAELTRKLLGRAKPPDARRAELTALNEKMKKLFEETMTWQAHRRARINQSLRRGETLAKIKAIDVRPNITGFERSYEPRRYHGEVTFVFDATEDDAFLRVVSQAGVGLLVVSVEAWKDPSAKETT